LWSVNSAIQRASVGSVHPLGPVPKHRVENLPKDEQMKPRLKYPRKRNHQSKTESTYNEAPPEIRGLAMSLPIDVSLGASYTDWGPEFSAVVRLPETNPYVRKVARPLSLVAHSVLPVVNQRPGLDSREVARLCSDPGALRAFLVEKQKQIEAFKPKRKAAFQEISGALSGGL
jgi:hypothetical protein